MEIKKIIKIYDKNFEPIRNSYKNSNKGQKYNKILDTFLDELNLSKNPKTRYIAWQRIARLNSQPLEIYLDENLEKIKNNVRSLKVEIPNKLTDKEKLLNKAYDYVKRVYEVYFEKFLDTLESEKILNDFDLQLLRGTFEVGKAFNIFGIKWLNHIKKQNEVLDKMFSYDTEKIMNYLKEKKLLEKDENGNFTDRSYSVIKGGKILSYAEAFPNEIKLIGEKLQEFIENLKKISGEYKQEYIDYLFALKSALEEKDISKLYSAWQKVDIAWMKIKYSIQIVHPMEYYDDKYRKAVAPEFDLRVKNEIFISAVKENIEKLFNSIDLTNYQSVKKFTKNTLNSVQLYISQPILFFGNYLNGHFSAQVVPNDESVSTLYGKKIFAFPKKVLEDAKLQPKTKLNYEIFGEKLLKDYEEILSNEKLFYKIYDIETIGHEFGHILWMDSDTEIKMNLKTGNFKNIEEFKATSGGFLAWLENSSFDKKFDYYLVLMHIFRVINLLKYRYTTEILPYYFEALIHLDLLYKSGILHIADKAVNINFNQKTYKSLKSIYRNTYYNLVKTYLEKKDAGKFLFKYVKAKDNYYLPIDDILRNFVEFYYSLYKKIGNEVI